MQPVKPVDTLTRLNQAIEQDGFALWSEKIATEVIDRLRASLDAHQQRDSEIRRRDQLYARRNLLTEVPEVMTLASHPMLLELVHAVLGPESSMLRALLFDKIPVANWYVGWHQDLMVPLAARHETEGFSAWSVKAGVVHAKPPAEVLQQIIILRVHLDDCLEANGPLRLMPGSHRQGELLQADLQRWIGFDKQQICLAPAGSVLLMRPLALHASSPAQRPSHRRVVHLEFAKNCLPPPLQWPSYPSLD